MNHLYRVVLVHRDRYLVRNEEKELYCVLTGSLRYRDEYPVVGDYVELMENPYGDSLIQSIRPRTSVFCRPDRRGHADSFVKTMQVQPLIANIDYVFIITSLNYNFSVNRIARYAAMTVSGGAIPVAVLTKADLCPDPEEREKEVDALSKDLQAVTISARTGYGMDRLRTYFRPGVTIALLGSSGAGKSTLINTLAGEELMRTGGIREEDSKGRHTTTHRELIGLNGVSFIDTPGLRELGMITHRNEPGCAVRQALEDGSLALERWELFRKLEKENRWSKVRKNEKMMNIAMNRRKLNQSRKKH